MSGNGKISRKTTMHFEAWLPYFFKLLETPGALSHKGVKRRSDAACSILIYVLFSLLCLPFYSKKSKMNFVETRQTAHSVGGEHTNVL